MSSTGKVSHPKVNESYNQFGFPSHRKIPKKTNLDAALAANSAFYAAKTNPYGTGACNS